MGGINVSAKIRIKCHIFMYITGKLGEKNIYNIHLNKLAVVRVTNVQVI